MHSKKNKACRPPAKTTLWETHLRCTCAAAAQPAAPRSPASPQPPPAWRPGRRNAMQAGRDTPAPEPTGWHAPHTAVWQPASLYPVLHSQRSCAGSRAHLAQHSRLLVPLGCGRWGRQRAPAGHSIIRAVALRIKQVSNGAHSAGLVATQVTGGGRQERQSCLARQGRSALQGREDGGCAAGAANASIGAGLQLALQLCADQTLGTEQPCACLCRCRCPGPPPVHAASCAGGGHVARMPPGAAAAGSKAVGRLVRREHRTAKQQTPAGSRPCP